jgi:hypothetical protein
MFLKINVELYYYYYVKKYTGEVKFNIYYSAFLKCDIT